MQFMMMVNADKNSEAGIRPSEEMLSRMAKFSEEMAKAGVLLLSGGLAPSSKGFRIKCSGGTLTVTDGPFIEAKELIGGFAIIQLESKEEAVELAKRFWEIHGDGEGEVRQMMSR
jgi:hypothetical protein